MLNKEICLKCVKDDFKRCNYYFSKGQLGQFEEDWGKGEVCCFFFQETVWTSVKKSPPKQCPYVLEQVLDSQNFSKKKYSF